MKTAIVLMDFEDFVLQRRGLNTKLKWILEDKKNERELWRERERERVRDVWKNRSLDEIHIIKLDSKIDFWKI